MPAAQAILALAALGGVEAPPIRLCDQKGCSKPAAFSYVWEWGEKGVCCADHQFLLQQSAGNISRSIQFTSLADQPSPPMQREERVRLRAEALVLGEELAEAKTRGLQLYQQNVSLTAQVQSLTTRGREAEAQLKDAAHELVRLSKALEASEADRANLADEAGRLRVLVDQPPPSVQELHDQLNTAQRELRVAQDELKALRAPWVPGGERTERGLGPSDVIDAEPDPDGPPKT